MPVPCAEEMSGRRRTTRVALLAASLAALVLGASAGAATLENARGWGGVELGLPSGWEKVPRAPHAATGDPQTLLVIGTQGVRPVESDCLVSSYRVPSDGAVVVVIGWHDSSGVSGIQPLSGLKLRRGTFECFAGRGGFAQVTRRNRDFQVNVMVGDRASAETVEDALAAARSFALAQRS
jgi:hypothetical protein